MRSLILFFIASFVLCLGLEAETYRVTAKNGLNVRSGANPTSHVVGQLFEGDIVEVYNVYDEWAEIEYSGGLAYISCKYIERLGEVAVNPEFSKPQNDVFLPILILMLTLLSAWLLGHEYYWIGVVSTIVLLGVTGYMLAFTDNPLWFVTEKGVGFVMMLVNMFIMFIVITLMWSCISVLMSWFCVDKVTICASKFLFALTLFSPGNMIIYLLLLWGIVYAIYRSIKESNILIFFFSIIGLIVCWGVVYWGGTICEDVFRGWDLAVLIVGLFPQLLSGIGSGSSSAGSSGELKQYSVMCDGKEYILTQDSKYSECNYTDQDGGHWTCDSNGFHPS